jgi:hypothetical protein
MHSSQLDRNKFVFFFLIIFVWLLPGDRISAQSYWDAIFQLGYDPLKQQVNNKLACQRINSLNEVRLRVSEHLDIDPEIRSRIQDLHSRLTSLDAANLYDILPHRDSAGVWRGVGVRGSSESQSYHLRMYDPDTDGWLTSAGRYVFRFSSPGAHLGDLDLRSFIRPEQKDTYRMAADAQIYLDDIPAQTVPRMLDGLLKSLWQHAGRDIKAPVKSRDISPLNRQSTSTLNALSRDFPELVRIILEYFEVKNIISSKPGQMDDSVFLEIGVLFKQQAFAKDFPAIDKLLKELKDSVFFRIRLHDDQNRLLGLVEIDSVDKEITVQLRTRKGHLLALVDGSGNRNKNSFSLVAPGYQQLYIAYDIYLNIVGLRLNIESLPIAVDYINRDGDLEIKICMWQPPEAIKTRGWAFGFIPLWLVNALIPSNVEEITSNFFRTLAFGNNGDGTRIDIESHGAGDLKNRIHLQAGTEVLGNGTIKLAFNMQRKVVAKQEALLKEIHKFNAQFADAFYRDYQKVKRIRGCQ